MGLINGALEIGRSALLAYQSALQVVGNNVSNVGSSTYTRQTPVLSPVLGANLPEGFTPGGGVALSGLQRNVDDALEGRIRYSLGDQAYSLIQQDSLGRIESVMNELSDTDLSTLLQNFFNAFSSVQNSTDDVSVRQVAITAGDSVAREIQRQRSDMIALRDELNRNIGSAVGDANKVCHDIADLNVRITAAESSSRAGSGALRDQRDDLLRQLGTLMQIETREQPDGGMNVYVGNEQLIQGGMSRGIISTLDTVDGQPKTVVRFADNNSPITLLGGSIAGMLASRDVNVQGHMQDLDGLANALINEVNKVHSQGQGLDGYTSTSGATTVMDADAVLNSSAAGLSLKAQNGSFQVTVKDKSTGLTQTTTIEVDLDGIGGNDDTLNSLVAQINAKVGNLTATATPDHRLSLSASNGFEFSFGQDSSNALASLGVNSFFVGSSAKDLTVNAALSANPRLLAVATNGTPGDGSNAGKIAALGRDPLPGLNNVSLTGYYNGIVSTVANTGAAAKARVDATDAINSSLVAQRESISGVSLDEETISLMRMERAFQGAAKYTSVVDQLMDEVLSIVK
jgi:flagellar hook-associated protein 1